jgi:general secretion pathway protein J
MNVLLQRHNLKPPGVAPGSGAVCVPASGRGFTLIEVLLALTVSAIVLAAMGGVFYSALLLRKRTTATVENASRLQPALNIIRRDLLCVMPPSGGLAGDFRCGSLLGGIGESLGIQFSTATAVIGDSLPWGNVQEVSYQLREASQRTAGGGRDLIRLVNRNLLTTALEEPEEQWMLGNVQSLQFSCYDGSQWRDSWDTSLGDTNLPTAVRIQLLAGSEDESATRNQQPVELIVPLVVQARNPLVSTNSGGGL